MKSNGVLLAVEDKLSDAVATKILKKRRDRGSIETDTTPDRRGRFPTKFLPPLNLSLGDGTQNDH